MRRLVARIFTYLKLYACYLQLNLIKNLSYRANFILGLLINLSGSLILFYFYEAVFDKLEVIGSWDKRHAMLLVGSYIIVEALYIGLAFHSFSLLPKLIVDGDLDNYLIRPISAKASLVFQEVDFGSILNALFGSWLIYYYGSASFTSFVTVTQYVVALGLGFFFLSQILFLLMSLAFWLGRVDELRDMLAWVMELGNKPAFIYPVLLRNLFYWILPFFLMANVPVEILLGERKNILIFLGALIPIYLLNQQVWRLGLKRYVSASH